MAFRLMVFACFVLNTVQSQRQPGYKPTHYYAQSPYEYHRDVPECAKNTTKNWCVEDAYYPHKEVQHALDYHYKAIQAFYKDVVVNTALSIDQLRDFSEETYLCPSTTHYIQPLRAVNIEGKWRVIVNRLESYGHKYTQSTRVEECDVKIGSGCPLVPHCYASKCIQKEIYHRFLVYNPYDYEFPFAIEKFKIPSACACLVGAFLDKN